MSEGNQTWPEQNAVDEWCEKHAAKGPSEVGVSMQILVF